MCYEIKVSLERQLKVARKFGDRSTIDELEQKLLPLLNPIEREYYRISGFDHPDLLLFDGRGIRKSNWGLVPHWVQSDEQANKIRNATLNARIEEIDQKPSFREAFRTRRAVLFVDGFYEFQHKHGKTFPYFIHAERSAYFSIACIYESSSLFSEHKETFSIVTRPAIGLMKDIHNNPKLNEPRMPLLLTDENIVDWLDPEKPVNELLKPSVEISAYTVRRTGRSGKELNNELSAEPFFYPEFQRNLFDE